jgi:hypothetical protein
MAVHRACGIRDPYPYPQYESDEKFFGKRATQVYFLIILHFFF